jgi:hypothetical protein
LALHPELFNPGELEAAKQMLAKLKKLRKNNPSGDLVG